MGDSITEGTIVSIGKALGDPIAAEEALISVETDKVTIDVRSPEAGVLKALFAKVGDTVIVGSDLFELELRGMGSSHAQPSPTQQPSTPSPTHAPPPAHSSAAAAQRLHPSGKPSAIRFIGRRNQPTSAVAHASSLVERPASSLVPPAAPPLVAKPVAASRSAGLARLWSVDDMAVDSRYARLSLTAAEIRAINSGGAE